MASALILIAAPGSRAIDSEFIHAYRKAFPWGGEPTWLAEQEACEIPISDEREATFESVLAKASPGTSATDLMNLWPSRPIDSAVLPAANRRKRLLLADMDSTMIGEECIDELGKLAGLGARISAITARAMAGEIDFEGALRERVSLLAGLPETAIAEVLAHRITFKPGGATLLATMKANGAHTALVSGGFVQFTGHVADRLGFHEHRANELLIESGTLTGTVREPILGRNAKLEALHMITARLGLSAQDAVTVGDGANDLPMLKAAGLGVALHAKPKVQAEAPVRINHGDLTALLYLQGYRRDEFLSAT